MDMYILHLQKSETYTVTKERYTGYEAIYGKCNENRIRMFYNLQKGEIKMTIIYDADLNGYIELIADDSNLFQRFTIKLSEDEYYRLMGYEDGLLSEIALTIGKQKTASAYYDGRVVFEWWIEGEKYSKTFSPYDGDRIRRLYYDE